MTSDTNESEILMGSSDVCTLLGIKDSTLRKYAGILKNAGYQFHVNDKGQRGYFNRDVVLLKRFMDIKQNPDMTLEQAADAVITWVQASGMAVSVIEEKPENDRYAADIEELKNTIERQNMLLAELIDRMDQQQKYIDERMNKRDELLMQSLRESQETKQMLLAAQEEEKNKSIWSRLFRK